LRDHQNDRPSSEPAVVPMMKPRMVERNVKPMSVHASPSVKKTMSVFQIALGCDQKKASSQPARAATSQPPNAATRMRTCVAMMAALGQSFCTGSRRAGLPAAGPAIV
jgi:hypothetical protein